MELLISELKSKIKEMKMHLSDMDLSDARLNELYSVYPFNKFEYVIKFVKRIY